MKNTLAAKFYKSFFGLIWWRSSEIQGRQGVGNCSMPKIRLLYWTIVYESWFSMFVCCLRLDTIQAGMSVRHSDAGLLFQEYMKTEFSKKHRKLEAKKDFHSALSAKNVPLLRTRRRVNVLDWFLKALLRESLTPAYCRCNSLPILAFNKYAHQKRLAHFVSTVLNFLQHTYIDLCSNLRFHKGFFLAKRLLEIFLFCYE